MPFCHFAGHNLWLLKPTKLNRGRGIHVCNTLSSLKTLIFKYCEGFQRNLAPAKALKAFDNTIVNMSPEIKIKQNEEADARRLKS